MSAIEVVYLEEDSASVSIVRVRDVESVVSVAVQLVLAVEMCGGDCLSLVVI